MMQMVVEKTRDRQQWREFFQPQRRKSFGCIDGTASKLTDLSDTNFIMLLHREALDRLRVRLNIILFQETLMLRNSKNNMNHCC